MDEEKEIQKTRTSVSVVDYFDWIEEEFEKKPPKKSKKQRMEWLKEINRLITECNELANKGYKQKIKIYNLQQ